MKSDCDMVPCSQLVTSYVPETRIQPPEDECFPRTEQESCGCPAPATDQLQSRVREIRPEPMTESLMKIPDFPKLFFYPARLDFLGKRTERFLGRVARGQGFINCFRSEHPALDGHVDAFESLRIEEAGCVADDEAAIDIGTRHGIPAAFGNRLGAVAHEFAAFEDTANERMHIEFLKCFAGIEERILVFEADDEAE